MKKKQRVTFELKFTVEGDSVTEAPLLNFLGGLISEDEIAGPVSHSAIWDERLKRAGKGVVVLGGAKLSFRRAP